MKKFFRIFRILTVAAAFAAACFVMHEPAASEGDDPCALDKDAAKQIFKNAETFEKIGEGCFYDVFDAAEKPLGRLLYIEPDENSVAGFGGNLRVAVGISPEGKVAGTEVGYNNESHWFIDRVRNEKFFEKWNGLSVEEASKADVDTISGATMSTTAIKSMVAQNLSKYSGAKIEPPQRDAAPLWLEIVVFVILAYSVFSFFFPQKTAGFRTIHLAVLVIVLGFIGGYALSMESFKNMALSLSIALVPLVILLLAAGLSLVTGKNFYCNFVCPFGAFQELLGRIPLPKKSLPPRSMKWISIFKIVLLILIYGFMVSGLLTDLTVFEPFSAFKFEAAALPSLIIAALFLLLSLFISRPWCRLFCPTGTLVALFAKKNGKEI